MREHLERWQSLTLSPADRAILDQMEEEMNKTGSGFTDANGKRVTVGDRVEYEERPGKLFVVTDITQDGDVQMESRKGKIINAKWRQVCKFGDR